MWFYSNFFFPGVTILVCCWRMALTIGSVGLRTPHRYQVLERKVGAYKCVTSYSEHICIWGKMIIPFRVSKMVQNPSHPPLILLSHIMHQLSSGPRNMWQLTADGQQSRLPHSGWVLCLFHKNSRSNLSIAPLMPIGKRSFFKPGRYMITFYGWDILIILLGFISACRIFIGNHLIFSACHLKWTT